MSGQAGEDLNEDLVNRVIQESSVSYRVGQELIVISKANLQLELQESLAKYRTLDRLLAVGGLFLALLTAVLASDFKKHLGVTGAQWTAVFAVLCVGSLGWLLVEGWCYAFRRKSLAQITAAIVEGGTSVQAGGVFTP